MFSDPHLAPRAANFRPLTPLDLLDLTLECHGGRPAVAWRDHIWSYAEFGALVARMAAALKAQGIGPGDLVSVALGNRPEMLAAHFAVPALGAALNTLNIRLSSAELGYILDHAGSKVLVAEAAYLPDPADAPLPQMVLCSAPGAGDGIDWFSGPVPDLSLAAAIMDEAQAISLNYTSGTTGKPKGVVYTHRGAYLNAMGNVLALGLTCDSRYLWTLPLFHCNGSCQAWAVTAAGGLHVCLDRVDPALIL